MAAASPPRAEATPAPPTKAAAPPISAGAERAAAEKAFHEQALFDMEQRFANDARGDGRSAQVQAALTTELEVVLAPDSRVQTLDCKLNTCRIEVSFPSLDADKASFARILQRMDGPFAQYGLQVDHQQQGDGKVKTVLFLRLG
ncbi:MAG TPA: hypothetical protein VHB79_12175 [Polyangiaceae bacterium]|nr:hypothetical protein [Polyangiaceae bacterium]